MPAAKYKSETTDPTRLSLEELVALGRLTDPSMTAAPLASGLWSGPFRGLRTGQGLDFDELRPFVPGDDPRAVDWKTSARRNALHTRLYREERDHRLSVLLDLRTHQFVGSRELTAVRSGRLAAHLLWRANHSGSRTSLWTLDHTGLNATPAAAGDSAVLDACALLSRRFDAARALACAATPDDSEVPTLAHALTRLLETGRTLGSLVLITSFASPGPDVDRLLRALTLARPTAVILAEDPVLARGLDPGVYPWRVRGEGRRDDRVTWLDRVRSKTLHRELRAQRTATLERISQSGARLLSTCRSDASVCESLREQGILP